MTDHRSFPGRQGNAALSRDNESFVAAGGYTYAPTSTHVDLAAPVSAALAAVRFYDPAATATHLANVTSVPGPGIRTAFEVTPETSTAAAARVHAEGGHATVLNYASATKPGGGYLSGARAQEEDICRSSALYTCLASATASGFYTFHRRNRDQRYTHRIIWTPDVPVFRDSASSALLPATYPTSFITAAAPNAGALATNNPAALPCTPLLADRAARVLAVAAHHGARTLVLGAWGCGVFRNAPHDVADVFRQLLFGGAFEGRFERVIFAVYDTGASQSTISAFRQAFPPGPDTTHLGGAAVGAGGGAGPAPGPSTASASSSSTDPRFPGRGRVVGATTSDTTTTTPPSSSAVASTSTQQQQRAPSPAPAPAPSPAPRPPPKPAAPAASSTPGSGSAKANKGPAANASQRTLLDAWLIRKPPALPPKP